MLNALFPLLVAISGTSEPLPQPVTRLNLPAVLSRAATHATVIAAQSAAEQAHAKADEINRIWVPRFDVSAAGGPSPEIKCFPDAAHCISTEPSQLQLGFAGAFWRVDAHLDMPVFTFGKLTAGMKAGAAGVRAAEAQALQAGHSIVFDASKAYFAVKLGRELQNMLQEGRDKVQDEAKRQEKLLEEGSGDVTEADHRRLLTLLAEIDARTSEAQHIEQLGLAGVHYAVGQNNVDVDEEPLALLDYTLPDVNAAMSHAPERPERMAAEAGVEAASHLSDLERARWWPDVVLIGSGTVARSSTVEHPANAFLNDPFNFTAGGLGLVLRWAPEAGIRGAKIAQADADLSRARATAELAREGLPADIERAWADLRDAGARLKASKQGERHAKAWLASVLQAEAAGLVEARDLADALLQFFMMRARTIQGTFDWNVGVMALQRATGKLPEPGHFVEED